MTEMQETMTGVGVGLVCLAAFVVYVCAQTPIQTNMPQTQTAAATQISPEQHDIEKAGKMLAYATVCADSVNGLKARQMIVTALLGRYGEEAMDKAVAIMNAEGQKAITADAAKRSIFDSNSWCKDMARELAP